MNKDLSFKVCSSANHYKASIGSPYPANKVPADLFKKYLDKTDSSMCAHCWHCREYQKNNRKQLKIKMEEKKKEKKTVFLTCQSNSHNVSGSIYKKDDVPIENFRKEYSKNDSDLYSYCIDCRNYKAKNLKVWRDDRIIRENFFFCYECNHEMPISERALNLDNSPSSVCISCKQLKKIYARKYTESAKNRYKMLLLKRIKENECSCMKCKCLFFQPENHGSLIPVVMQTYTKNDNTRYINFEGFEFSVIQIIEKYEELLELRILQFDHLPEEEQRKLELLEVNEEYIPKHDCVSSMKSEKSMMLEADKCQHLCVKCHIEETMKRENPHPKRSIQKQEKMNFVNEIKKNGCSFCKYKNVNLLRYFDMDHLNPNEKIENIARMVQNDTFLLKDVEKECQKCRVLCKSCHLIHTDEQRKKKII